MNFGDIDFSALGRMMDMLSDDEKNRLSNMANDMMQNMKGNLEAEEEASVPFEEAYGIADEDLAALCPAALSALEAAWDLENFYDEDEEADYSGTVLFLSKALLHQLRLSDGSNHSRLQDYAQDNPAARELMTALYRAESDAVDIHALAHLKRVLFAERGLFA